MLNTEDIVTLADVLTLDTTALIAFGVTTPVAASSIQDKRGVAVQQWLRQELIKAGYVPDRHSLRMAPASAYRYTGGSWVDITSSCASETEELDLDTALVTPGSDFLYFRSGFVPKALQVVMQDSVNVNTLSFNSLQYWNGHRWQAFSSLTDATVAASIAFSGGGAISWQRPTDWDRRSVNGETEWGYWTRLTTSRALSAGTKATQLLTLKPSVLMLPAAYKALHLLYSEAWGAQPSEYQAKAKEYGTMAKDALASALSGVVDEFVAPGEEAVKPDSDQSNRPDPSLFEIQRG